MVLVCTVGRSGSSALMKFFAECGIDVGTDTWFDEFNAGMEHKDSVSINNDLIGNIIKDKKHNEYFIWGRIHDLKLDVYKDPQFLIHPDIIKHWWKVRKDIKIIFLYRNADDIVESCKRMPEWTGPTYRLFPEMIEQKTDDFLRQVKKLGIPIKKYKYPFNSDMAIDLAEWIDVPMVECMEAWEKVIK